MNEYVNIARRAAIAGMGQILSQQNSFRIELKSDDTPVTSADIASNAAVCEILSQSGLPICSEEQLLSFEERKNLDKFWLIDPLDGTRNFIAKNGEYCVCIALIQDARPVVAAIGIPLSAEVFYASEKGAFKDIIDKNGETLATIDLSKTAKNAGEILYVGAKDKVAKELATRLNYGIKYIGSAIKFARVAENGGVYLRTKPSSLWDNAAGEALIKFSGGEMVALSNAKPIEYNTKETLCPFFIALSRENLAVKERILSLLDEI